MAYRGETARSSVAKRHGGEALACGERRHVARHRVLETCAACVLGVVVGCGSDYVMRSSEAAPGRAAADPAVLEAEEATALARINAARAEASLGELEADAALTRAARDFACVLANEEQLSHTGPDGSTFVERMCAAGFEPACSGQVAGAENLAAGAATGDATFEQWLGSAGHRRNMLGAPYTLAGIGRCVRPGTRLTYFWTLLVAAR